MRKFTVIMLVVSAASMFYLMPNAAKIAFDPCVFGRTMLPGCHQVKIAQGDTPVHPKGANTPPPVAVTWDGHVIKHPRTL